MRKLVVIALAALVAATNVAPTMAAERISENKIFSHREQQLNNNNYRLSAAIDQAGSGASNSDLYNEMSEDELRNFFKDSLITEEEGVKGIYYFDDDEDSFFLSRTTTLMKRA